MPKLTNESSSTPGFPRGFKSKAENVAINCRRNLGLKDYDPLSSFSLAEHLNLRITNPLELGLGENHLNELLSGHGSTCWSAITIGREAPSLIIHNTTHSAYRIESNIMHELAHVLLEHRMSEIDTSLGIPLRKYDAQQEIEAEWLGGCLQLPKAALVKYYVYQSLSEREISEKFNASIPMVNYRIRVAGIKVLKARLGK